MNYLYTFRHRSKTLVTMSVAFSLLFMTSTLLLYSAPHRDCSESRLFTDQKFLKPYVSCLYMIHTINDIKIPNLHKFCNTYESLNFVHLKNKRPDEKTNCSDFPPSLILVIYHFILNQIKEVLLTWFDFIKFALPSHVKIFYNVAI